MPYTLKRPLDVIGAAAALILLSPLMTITAIMIAGSVGRPVLFRQRRAGRGARLFLMTKFRTMTYARDASGRLLDDEHRLTRVGRLVRSLSLDELPQLWNVLVGDMSLVGPRPLLAEYITRYSPRQRRRLEVRPGITGWAQVHGRNSLSWEEKFELDVWYVEHESFWLDLRIIAATIVQVVRRQGIQHAGEATMPEFLGPANGGSPATGIASTRADVQCL
jgi:sugar transferase EpsL